MTEYETANIVYKTVETGLAFVALLFFVALYAHSVTPDRRNRRRRGDKK